MRPPVHCDSGSPPSGLFSARRILGRKRRTSTVERGSPPISAPIVCRLVCVMTWTGARSTNMPGGVEYLPSRVRSATRNIDMSGNFSPSATPKSLRNAAIDMFSRSSRLSLCRLVSSAGGRAVSRTSRSASSESFLCTSGSLLEHTLPSGKPISTSGALPGPASEPTGCDVTGRRPQQRGDAPGRRGDVPFEVAYRPEPVAMWTAGADVDLLDLLAPEGLHRIAPQRADLTQRHADTVRATRGWDVGPRCNDGPDPDRRRGWCSPTSPRPYLRPDPGLWRVHRSPPPRRGSWCRR